MLKHVLHIITSFLLAVLLLFGGTAKEFVHLFASHEDTVCHVHHHGELAFENEHHHCDFLSFSLSAFITQDLLLPLRFTPQSFPSFSTALPASTSKHTRLTPSLRGPPTAC